MSTVYVWRTRRPYNRSSLISDRTPSYVKYYVGFTHAHVENRLGSPAPHHNITKRHEVTLIWSKDNFNAEGTIDDIVCCWQFNKKYAARLNINSPSGRVEDFDAKELINALNTDYKRNVVKLCRKATKEHQQYILRRALYELQEVREKIITQQQIVDDALASITESDTHFKECLDEFNIEHEQLETSPV